MQVNSFLPSANAAQIEIFEVIRATFSKPLNPVTVNEFNIKLIKSVAGTLTPIEPQKDSLGNVTGITYEESDHSIVFKPQAELEYDTDYIVQFLADRIDNFGIKDIGGNVLVPNAGKYFTWTFTTKPSPIVTPILQSYSPLSSSIITDMFQPIEVDIDETQFSQVPTLDQISMSVKLYDSMEWAGNVTYDQQNGVIRFTPTESGWPYNARLRVYASMRDAQSTIFDINWYINTRDALYDPLTIATLTDGNQTTTAKPYTFSVSLFNVVNPINHSKNGNVSVVWIEISDIDKKRKIFTLNNNVSLGWDVPSEEITDPLISVNDIQGLTIVADSLNNNTAIWNQQDSIGRGLWASRYSKSTAWSIAKKYSTPHNLQTMPPPVIGGISKTIVPDNQGNVTVIWGLRSPATSIINLYAARYNQGFNWEATQQIENNIDSDETLGRIEATPDTNSNVSVVWVTGNNKAYSTSYIAGDGWQSGINTSPNLLFKYTGNTGIRNYKILSDKAGNITMFWELITTNPVDNSFNEDLWGIRYNVGVGWEPPVNIENDSFPNVYFSSENGDADKKGNATIVWRQSQFIKATRYNSGAGWLSNDQMPAQPIADLGVDTASYFAVSADNGDLFIIWKRKTVAKTYNLYAKRYDKDTGWESTPVLLFSGYNPNESFNIFYRKADDFGNLSILLSYDNKIFAANYLNGFGWASGDQVYAKNIITLKGPIKKLGLPKAVMDKAGNVTVIWTKEIVSDSNYQVFAKRYNPMKGWSPDEIKLAENLVWTERFYLGVDSSGRVALVWTDKNKLFSVFIE